jgi:hypothetical protein
MARDRQHQRRPRAVAIKTRTGDAVNPARTGALPARSSMFLLAAIMGVSLVLHLWGIRRELPVQYDIDEPPFVMAAVRIAATGNLNPGWFGHPASTLIYPLAAVYRGWDIIDRPGFMNGTSEFYMLGRYVSVAYAVLSLPLVFLVGRRAFASSQGDSERAATVDWGAVVGLIGAWFTVLAPMAVDHAQTARADSTCVFFTLLTLWLCLRLSEQPTLRRVLLAGTACGLAVSTKFSLAALVAVLIAALWRKEAYPPAERWKRLGAGLLTVLAAFMLSSPYLFIDSATALANLHTEARSTHLGADGFSPVQNFYWYATAVIPSSLGWPRLLLVVGAVALVVWRRQSPALILLGFTFVFLIGISLHPLHWARWVIPLLPVCMLFAAAGLCSAVGLLGSRQRLPAVALIALLLLAVAGLSYGPGKSIVAADIIHGYPSTQILARAWVIEHLPAGSRIAQEWFTAPLDKTSFEVGRQLSLADHSVEEYAGAGYRYIMVSSFIYQSYLNEPARYPAQVEFYRSLAARGRLLQEITGSATHGGPTVRIYEISAPPLDTENDSDDTRRDESLAVGTLKHAVP